MHPLCSADPDVLLGDAWGISIFSFSFLVLLAFILHSTGFCPKQRLNSFIPYEKNPKTKQTTTKNPLVFIYLFIKDNFKKLLFFLLR